jgi:DNA-binding NtrC family response regulator
MRNVDDQTTMPDDPAEARALETPLALSVVSFEEPAPTGTLRLSRAVPTSVGRQPGSTQLTVVDLKMSRVHFRISWDGRSRAFRIEDQQTRNGTYLNGRRVHNESLRQGDVVRAGDSLFVCHSIDDGAERTRQQQAAASGVPVFLTGETGTGKERLARRIHEESGRKKFVAVNCGAIPSDLIASELFGHVRGAFSGATAPRPGLFVTASGGTLFLDEVCELPIDVQPALLRALDDFRIRAVGAEQEVPVDVRVIAATNANPEEAIQAGSFRADLYARLAGYVLSLPPLRRVRERILPVAGAIAREETAPAVWTTDALEALLLWDWPYNIRELKSLVLAQRGAGRQDGWVTLSQLERARPDLAARLSERRSGAAELVPSPGPARAELTELLDLFQGNVSAIAQHTGRSRASVYRWMRQVGLLPSGQQK